MKNERGYRRKANHFSSWSRPMKVLSDSDVPVSREIVVKLCQIYTKIHIYKILKIWNLNYVTRTPTNDSAVYWSPVSFCITWPVSILHCHWCEFWSRDTDVKIILSIISIKSKNKNYKIIIGENLIYN